MRESDHPNVPVNRADSGASVRFARSPHPPWILAQRDRRGFALQFFTEARRRMEAAGSAPVLGVYMAMGEDAPLKIARKIGYLTPA